MSAKRESAKNSIALSWKSNKNNPSFIEIMEVENIFNTSIAAM